MHNPLPAYLTAIAVLLAVPAGDALATGTVSILPLTSDTASPIVPSTVGVIINDSDPASLELGQFYASRRGIPVDNIVHLKLPRVKYVARHLFVREFERLKTDTRYSRFRAFALAFAEPYRVDNNQSITSAFSQGIASIKWLGVCSPTVENADFGRPAGARLENKPAMLLTSGGTSADDRALIERGKSSDGSDPGGTVYLVKTSDAARSKPREPAMDQAATEFGSEIAITRLTTNTFASKDDIIGYQTGLPTLSNLETLGFRPGAYADHLTSYGGAIADERGQTPITALILAGATASYGTVREPCNFPVKFPNPERMLGNYLRGDTLIEAYWKSVAMTTEGLFIGEPLARPFPPFSAHLDGDAVTLTANRHSRAFFAAQSGAEQAPGGGHSGSHLLGVYDVRSGLPELLDKLTVSADFREGDILGTVKLKAPENPALDVQLGVLLQDK